MPRHLLRSGPAVDARADVLVLPMFSGDEKLKGAALKADRKSGGLLTALLGSGDVTGKADELVVQAMPGGALPAGRVALLGLGERDDFDAQALRRGGAVVANALGGRAKSVVLAFDDVPVKTKTAAAAAQAWAEGVELALYQFAEFKKGDKPELTQVALASTKERLARDLRRALKRGVAIAKGVALARDLGNLPGNHGRPKVLASKARAMARKTGLRSQTLGRKDMERLGMGSLLSVSLGSPHEPQLIVLERNKGKRGVPTVCLVGKGLTFDSGGISIKPAGDMDKMRYDKCGGCVVVGTMQVVSALDLPLHVVGLVPSSENMPGGDANKPGDVVKASNGKTIEILNTDAEGRLILADALVYAQRFKPDVVIDLATLTGACMVALGTHCCGLMTESDDLADELARAGERAFERAWRLPLWSEYTEEMKGSTTDLKNLGGRYGGAITAGAFLGEFTGDHKWAHLDIAGVSWDDGARPYNRGKGATGFGVRLLTEYLRGLNA